MHKLCFITNIYQATSLWPRVRECQHREAIQSSSGTKTEKLKFKNSDSMTVTELSLSTVTVLIFSIWADPISKPLKCQDLSRNPSANLPEKLRILIFQD